MIIYYKSDFVFKVPFLYFVIRAGFNLTNKKIRKITGGPFRRLLPSRVALGLLLPGFFNFVGMLVAEIMTTQPPQESVLFIGTQFSILYTFMYSPA